MAKKIFKYRGKTAEELKQMDFNEFLKLLPAKQRRSLKKGFTESQKKLLKQVQKFKEGKKKKPVKTHCRNLVIVPDLIGATIHIYNGKTFVPILIKVEMIGHSLGEFAQTRTRVSHNMPGVGATRSSAAVSVK